MTLAHKLKPEIFKIVVRRNHTSSSASYKLAKRKKITATCLNSEKGLIAERSAAVIIFGSDCSVWVRSGLACSRLLERRAKERARGRKRRGPPRFRPLALSFVFVPSPSPLRFSLGAWNRLVWMGQRVRAVAITHIIYAISVTTKYFALPTATQ